MKGLTGILRPNGVFVECSYGNHGLASSKIPQTEEEKCVYLSSSKETQKNDKASIVYFNETITQKQFAWFLMNFNELDKKQQEFALDHFLENKLLNKK